MSYAGKLCCDQLADARYYIAFFNKDVLPKPLVDLTNPRKPRYAPAAVPARLRRSLLLIAAVFGLTFATGALGYWLIEGWDLIDSIYMAVITVTTVGFEEVRPLSASGRAFTAILILLGVGGITYAFGAITNYVIAGEVRGYLGARRMEKKISAMSNHFVVCGFGRMGQEVCRELQREGRAFLVVDPNEDSLAKAADLGYTVLNGDPGLDRTLMDSRIDKAIGLAAVSDDDAKNLMVVISARGLQTDLAIVARVGGEDAPEKFLRAGANGIFLPYRTGGRRVAQMLLRPAVVGFIEDILHDESSAGMLMENFRVEKGSRMESTTLAQARIREKTGAYVVGLQRETGLVAELDPHTVLEIGDTVIAIGKRHQLDRLGQYLVKG